MNAYADTSALFALFHIRDAFARNVNARQMQDGADFLFPPLLRFELRHVLTLARTDADGETAWHSMRAAEGRRLRGVGIDFLELVRRAGELSLELGRECPDAGAADVLHVAAAMELGAAEFWTCDAGQADFARAAGLPVVQFQPDAPKRTR